MSLRTWFRPRPATSTRPSPRPRTRLGVLPLEDRSVPAADLLSALGVGSTEGSKAFDVATDAVGNSYLTGYFSGTTDFDPAHTLPGDADVLTPRGGADAFVAKYAPDDTLVWVRRMGGDDPAAAGSMPEAGRKVAVDGGGNVYVVGDFVGAADFGATTLTAADGRDGFVAKLAADGTVRWAAGWGNGTTYFGCGVGVDTAGNVYALGTRTEGVESATNPSGYDVLKFGPTGAAAWSKWLPTHNVLTTGDLVVDPAGNVFVGGGFRYTVDFDPGPRTQSVASGPSRSGFVLKLTTAGAFGWVTPFVGQTAGGTYGSSSTTSVALDGTGGVVVGGFYDNTVDFNPGNGTTTLPTSGGGFVAKLAGSGSLTWAKALPRDPAATSTSVLVNGVAVDAAGSIYVTGSFAGTADFDPGAGTALSTSTRNAAGTADSQDVFVLKLTAAGGLVWAETVGGSGDDRGMGVAVDPAGGVRLAGFFQGTVDFDPDPGVAFDLTAAGTRFNLFLIRLR